MSSRPPLTLSDLHSAWQRVRENQGCAGVDGVTLQQFAQRLDHHLQTLLTETRDGAYRPLPLLRILLEKKPGGKATRTLLVPPVRDRVLQTAVARQLSLSYEEEFLDASFAYRPGRGVDRAIARLRQLRDLGFDCVLDADIQSFFDNVPWPILESRLQQQGEEPHHLSLISAWIRAPFWDGARLRQRSRGIPQGAPISPLLANIHLAPLDAALSRQDAKLIRYADDFLVLTRNPQSLAAAEELTASTLASLGLSLHPQKTRRTSFSEGFRFLGVTFLKDEIFTPWKQEPKAQGRLLSMARPMPAPLLERFLAPTASNSIPRQLQREGLRWLKAKPNNTASGLNSVAYLYLTQQGATLRKSGDRFLVVNDDQILLDLPYDKLEHILIFGHVQVTTQAMGELLDKGVDISYFTWRGQFRGSLTPPRSANIHDRLAQLNLWQNASRSLALARAVVAAKIHNQAQVLRHFPAQAPPPDSSHSLAAAPDIPTLMGIEGAAARAYFQTFGRNIPAPFRWTSRQPRPALDPVNALLNLTYTLLTQEMASLLEAEGLEIALGALHQLDRGRPSLALDLIEPFRAPVADRFVLAALRQHQFAPDDFVQPEGGGMVLTQAALRRYFRLYEHWMLTESRRATAKLPAFRQLLRGEVRRYLLFLRGQAEFIPYHFGADEETLACDISSVTI